MTVYGGGFGGKCSDDPRRRRCGTAIVALAPDGEGTLQVGAALGAPLIGPCQTAPTPELLAICLMLEKVSGGAVFVTDRKNIARNRGCVRFHAYVQPSILLPSHLHCSSCCHYGSKGF